MHLRRLLAAADVQASVELPPLPIDDFGGDAEHVVGMVPAQWRLREGPLGKLTRAIEAAGVVVVQSPLSGSSVDGVTFRAPGLLPLAIMAIKPFAPPHLLVETTWTLRFDRDPADQLEASFQIG